MKSNDIRDAFLRYFQGLGHEVVKSAGLIPQDDPTLFFVNAGMVPFKRYFTGEETAPYRRAVSSQKCLRVSGKHNDLENVGVTARHHTFFEMLGNFSFGDYFKKDAIAWGWEFLTKTCGLPVKDLWVTVYQDDDEAACIWEKDIGVSKDRIVRLGEKDNFWAMGPTGPCGPCSEIHVDRGGECGLNNPDCSVACDCDRFMEVWNLVFMQYNRDESGQLHPLPKPSIDTGMGLERLSMVLQGKASNYDTDLFQPIITDICRLTKKTYGRDPQTDISIRVLADHIRSTSFLIADGVLPSNEGRGYVLRRIMRRAIRHGRLLGQRAPFFHHLYDTLAAQMGHAYSELSENAAFVKKVIKTEEERFLETLDRGTALLEDEMTVLSKAKKTVLPGEVGFKLYDTYGFPADLTEIMLRDRGFELDWDGFDAAMQAQRAQGRDAWKGSGAEKTASAYLALKEKLPTSVFTGYDGMSTDGKILAILREGQSVSQATVGDEVELVMDRTPFYPEGGGQVGDRGVVTKSGANAMVSTTRKPVEGLIVHHAKIKEGTLALGETVQLQVEESRRTDTMKNHTATHLLHAALRRHLGEHVKQAGSLVDAERLRFDFSHFEPVSPSVLRAMEDEINALIRTDIALLRQEMPHSEAIAKGALAFFGEKYGERVRVVQVGEYSTELCGGTHVARTGEIGLIKIVSESGVASGVRRIEAVTGREAVAVVHRLEDICSKLASTLKSSVEDVPDRVEKLQSRLKTLEKETEALKTKVALGGGSGGASWKDAIRQKDGVSYLVYETGIASPDALRGLSDEIRSQFQSGVCLLIGRDESRVFLLATVPKDLQGKFHAGKLIQALAPLVGGKGGGRPDMAQGGGPDLAGIPTLSAAFEQFLG